MPIEEEDDGYKFVQYDVTDYRFFLALVLIISTVALWIVTAVIYGIDSLMGVISATISLISTVLSFYFVQVSYEKNQQQTNEIQASRGKYKEIVMREVEQRILDMQSNLKSSLETFLDSKLRENDKENQT